MVYISERIVNISELEDIIGEARIISEVLTEEIEKSCVEDPKLINAAHEIKDLLRKAENFEFHIEKRKCEFKETS